MPASSAELTPGWSERRESLKQIRRFIVIGTSSVVVDLSLYAALTALLHLDTVPAKGLSYFSGMIVGFVGNKLWTFESSRKSVAEPIIYIALYATSLGVNVVCNEAALRIGHVLDVLPERENRIVAVLFATGVTTVLNFLGMRLITFRRGIRERRDAVTRRASRTEEGAS